MDIREKVVNVCNTLAVMIPAALVLLSVFLSPYGYTNLTQTWNKFWQVALVFYANVFFIFLYIFVKEEKHTFENFRSRFQFWFAGLILSIFSSMIARIFWDIAFFINYAIKVGL